jgi:transposase
MLNDLAPAQKVYLACGHTDMRKSIDGLATLVQQSFELDPFSPVAAHVIWRPESHRQWRENGAVNQPVW